MPKRSTDQGGAIAAMHDSIGRRIRITDERIKLGRAIEIALRSRPDVRRVVPRGLEDLPSYVRLADEGVAHATVGLAAGTVIVLAAGSRVWRRPNLKRQLMALKRDADRLGRRVVLVTKRGLARASARRIDA